MKNQNYYVLKTIYKLSRKNNDDFIPLKTLLSKKCPENVITYLEFRNYLNYKRENKTDYYSITLKGIESLCQHKWEKFHIWTNTAISLLALLSAIPALVLTIKQLLK